MLRTIPAARSSLAAHQNKELDTHIYIGYAHTRMNKISMTKAAQRLGISPIALSRYVAQGKLPAPEIVKLGRSSIHLWTAEDIERARTLLPKIANGRKTRYQKKKGASTQKSAKTKKKKK